MFEQLSLPAPLATLSFKARHHLVQLVFILKGLIALTPVPRLLHKDVTASGFVNAGRLLGFCSTQAQRQLNAGVDVCYYDAYTYIIEAYKKSRPLGPEWEGCTDSEFVFFFTRKALKPVMMCEQYGAGRSTCHQTFREFHAAARRTMSKVQQERVDKEFLCFYLFCKTAAPALLYEADLLALRNELTAQVRGGAEWLALIDGSAMPIAKFKQKTVDVVVRHLASGYEHTTSIMTHTKSLDQQKIYRSV